MLAFADQEQRDTQKSQPWYGKVPPLTAVFDVLDRNTRRMSNIHAHLLLMLRNATPAELTLPLITTIVTCMVFLSTRHQWNRDALDKLKRTVAIDEQKEADELKRILKQLKKLDLDEPQLLETLLLWKHDQQPHDKP